MVDYLQPKINIAIDGASACGKSTLAKKIAEALNYICLDTGAMFRAIAYYFITNEIDFLHLDAKEIEKLVDQINLEMVQKERGYSILLNGEIVEEVLRSAEVNGLVSQIGKNPIIRKKLLAMQQTIARNKGVVMDGRDIGTAVLPEAELKIFLTASLEERVARRAAESEMNENEIRANLLLRDQEDSNRLCSPLRQAKDAIVLDNTNLTLEEELAMLLALAKCRIQKI